MTVARDVGVVIVAGGQGTRTGQSELKQFRWVAGKPMLLHSLQAFHARADVAVVVCVIPRAYVGDPPPWILQCDVDRLLVSVGGASRSESVMNGLEDLPPEVKFVLIHDAARPLAGDAMIERVVAQARLGTGAVAGLPVTDTLKQVDGAGRIVQTVDRTSLWRAQTPQGFPREMIEAAYREAYTAGIAVTDDSALCERMGFPVVVVPGSERAMKVTTAEDFARVEAAYHLPE
jgi:2-C-methyl-D-erythritol 4-phosphate cytidylyltransferase